MTLEWQRTFLMHSLQGGSEHEQAAHAYRIDALVVPLNPTYFPSLPLLQKNKKVKNHNYISQKQKNHANAHFICCCTLSQKKRTPLRPRPKFLFQKFPREEENTTHSLSRSQPLLDKLTPINTPQDIITKTKKGFKKRRKGRSIEPCLVSLPRLYSNRHEIRSIHQRKLQLLPPPNSTPHRHEWFKAAAAVAAACSMSSSNTTTSPRNKNQKEEWSKQSQGYI